MNSFAWCTYRNWSFEVLEGLLDSSDARCAAILTTENCIYDFARFEARGIKIFRLPPKTALKANSPFLEFAKETSIKTMFFYGWSWFVPADVFNSILCLTLHPGLLPDGRGGSPIQNQIRQGQTWTYANLIELSAEMDKGDIFGREKISLEGDVSDVWQRMTSVGVLITKRFLKDLATNQLKRTVQPPGGEFSYRVTAEDAILKPQEQEALKMYNIIRAHNENDPNGYVKKANLTFNKFQLSIHRSTLHAPGIKEYSLAETSLENICEICHQTNNNEACLSLTGSDGKKIFITQFQVKT